MYLIHSYSHSFRTRDVKAGKVYDVVFRVTDERGNVRQKRLSGFATKQNAEKAFVEYVAKFCTLVEDHPSRSECPSFAAAADKYLEYSRFMNAASTAIKRMSYFSLHYLPRFGALPLNRISSADVFRWFDALVSEPRRGTDKCYAPRSLRSIWEQLHAFFEWCSERYSVPNPMRGLKRPRMKATAKTSSDCSTPDRTRVARCLRGVMQIDLPKEKRRKPPRGVKMNERAIVPDGTRSE